MGKRVAEGEKRGGTLQVLEKREVAEGEERGGGFGGVP